MKLIDIMKRYNKCILKENAKLRSIYNTLIRECDGADTENECDVSERDDEKKNECSCTRMSVAEFLGECDKDDTAKNAATDECDACGDDSCKDGEKCGRKEGEIEEGDKADDAKKEKLDEINDNDLMTAEEFFGGAEKSEKNKETDECDACGDDSCKDGEKCGRKEGEIEEGEIEEEDELISKKEFYAANESDEKAKKVKDEDVKEDEDDVKEDEELKENKDAEKPEEIKEKETEKTEKKENTEKGETEKEDLDESLEKRYLEANRKLFNF